MKTLTVGKTYKTIDGSSVVILVDNLTATSRPVLGLVTDTEGRVFPQVYTRAGKMNVGRSISELDLVIEPQIFPWESLPAWARYVAKDENGESYWFMEQPIRRDECFVSRTSKVIPSAEQTGYIPPRYIPQWYQDEDWKESLIVRPKQ